MRSQLSGTINVEVDAAPQQDLNRVLEEIRAQYEGLTDKYRREQEVWFNEKVKRFPFEKKGTITHMTGFPTGGQLVIKPNLCETK